MGRRRKKQQISTQTAIILAGSAVAVVSVIGIIIMIRSSFPARHRGWDDFRDVRPVALARTPDEAWKLLKGKWGRTNRAGNAVTKIEYEFTDDRRVIFRSSLTGGVLPKPQTNEIVNRVVAVELDDDDILLTIEGGQGEMWLWFESPTVLVVEGEDFRRLN